MNKKQKILVTLFIVVMFSAVICRAYTNYKLINRDERTYVELNEETRPISNKFNTFTAYDCGLKVNWNWTKDGLLYEVRTPDGLDHFWSKEAIAEYIYNSKTTEYFQ